MIQVSRSANRSLCIYECREIENSEPRFKSLYLRGPAEAPGVIAYAFDRVENIDHPLSRRQRHEGCHAELALIHEEWLPLLDSTGASIPSREKSRK